MALTYETTFEFSFDSNTRAVRLWFAATCVEYPRDSSLIKYNWIREQIRIHWRNNRARLNLAQLADWIVHTFPGIAAVQTMDKITGFGNVIYVDWP